MPVTYTPIRYPGGKSKIYPMMDAILTSNGMVGCTYAEAFCGGAGLAMRLLAKGRVERVILNDIDPAVYSMWKAIVHEPEEMCQFVENTELSIDEWRAQREVFEGSKSPSLELGKAAFYLNRTNRSGILRGGPIGGTAQNGRYGIGARFNRDGLVSKIRAVAAASSRIELYNLDACEFIDSVLNGNRNTFAYFDPPYIEKGPELYENSFDKVQHRKLAGKIASCTPMWMVTYDQHQLVDDVYSEFNRFDLPIGYSAQTHKRVFETLIMGPGVIEPTGLLPRMK